jgi:hypothetical protein
MASVIHSGRLRKQGALFKTWRSRLFELSDDKKLRYFKFVHGSLLSRVISIMISHM